MIPHTLTVIWNWRPHVHLFGIGSRACGFGMCVRQGLGTGMGNRGSCALTQSSSMIREFDYYPQYSYGWRGEGTDCLSRSPNTRSEIEEDDHFMRPAHCRHVPPEERRFRSRKEEESLTSINYNVIEVIIIVPLIIFNEGGRY